MKPSLKEEYLKYQNIYVTNDDQITKIILQERTVFRANLFYKYNGILYD